MAGLTYAPVSGYLFNSMYILLLISILSLHALEESSLHSPLQSKLESLQQRYRLVAGQNRVIEPIQQKLPSELSEILYDHTTYPPHDTKCLIEMALSQQGQLPNEVSNSINRLQPPCLSQYVALRDGQLRTHIFDIFKSKIVKTFTKNTDPERWIFSSDGRYFFHTHISAVLLGVIPVQTLDVYDTLNKKTRTISAYVMEITGCISVPQTPYFVYYFPHSVYLYNCHKEKITRLSPLGAELPRVESVMFNQANNEELAIVLHGGIFTLYNLQRKQYDRTGTEVRRYPITELEAKGFVTQPKDTNPFTFTQSGSIECRELMHLPLTNKQLLLVEILLGVQQALHERHEKRKQENGYKHQQPMPIDFDLILKYNPHLEAAQLHETFASCSPVVKRMLVQRFNIVKNRSLLTKIRSFFSRS